MGGCVFPPLVFPLDEYMLVSVPRMECVYDHMTVIHAKRKPIVVGHWYMLRTYVMIVTIVNASLRSYQCDHY